MDLNVALASRYPAQKICAATTNFDAINLIQREHVLQVLRCDMPIDELYATHTDGIEFVQMLEDSSITYKQACRWLARVHRDTEFTVLLCGLRDRKEVHSFLKHGAYRVARYYLGDTLRHNYDRQHDILKISQ